MRISTKSPGKRSGRFGTASGRKDSGTDVLLCRAIAGTTAGDAQAVHFLYVRFADDVRGCVQSIVREPHVAEDITEIVFAKLPEAIREYEQGEMPFETWILEVAGIAALDHVRVRSETAAVTNTS